MIDVARLVGIDLGGDDVLGPAKPIKNVADGGFVAPVCLREGGGDVLLNLVDQLGPPIGGQPPRRNLHPSEVLLNECIRIHVYPLR